LEMNRNALAVHYTDLVDDVQRNTGKKVSLRTIQRYGKERLRIKNQTTIKREERELNADLCEEIAKFRRWAHRLGKKHLLFLDETALKLNEAPRSTLVHPGQRSYVIVDDNTTYAARMDMIGLISSQKLYPPIIFTPKDRAVQGVKGLTTEMLIHSIEDLLAQAIGEDDDYPTYLVLDNATIHNKNKMLEAFHFNGAQNLVDIKYMPALAAKRLSPLDNTLFHQWKERVRRHQPLNAKNIVSIMSNEWVHLPHEHLINYYRHCGLMRGQDVYMDCPMPTLHHHAS